MTDVLRMFKSNINTLCTIVYKKELSVEHFLILIKNLVGKLSLKGFYFRVFYSPKTL